MLSGSKIRTTSFEEIFHSSGRGHGENGLSVRKVYSSNAHFFEDVWSDLEENFPRGELWTAEGEHLKPVVERRGRDMLKTTVLPLLILRGRYLLLYRWSHLFLPV